jgi:hypothetical protein
MYTREGYERIFADAVVPPPTVIDMLSGASLFVVERPA